MATRASAVMSTRQRPQQPPSATRAAASSQAEHFARRQFDHANAAGDLDRAAGHLRAIAVTAVSGVALRAMDPRAGVVEERDQPEKECRHGYDDKRPVFSASAIGTCRAIGASSRRDD